MTPTNLDHTLEKYLKLQLTPIQSSRVELWLRTMRENSYHGEDIGRNDEEQLSRMILSDHEPAHGITEFLPKYGNRSYMKGKKTLLITTFSMTLCLLTCLLYLNGLRLPAGSLISGAPVTKVFLQDGTIVLGSSDSKLAYSESNDSRQVFFTGKGLFEISESHTSPLRLNIKDVVVKISGACFVQTSTTGFKVQVLDGVAVSQTNDTTGEVCAEKGEQLEFKTDVIQTSSVNMMDIPTLYLSRYLMKFDKADFLDVVSRIQDKFGVIILAGDFEHQKISGDFTGKSLSETLDLFSGQMGLEYSIDGNIIKLKIRSDAPK